MSAVISEMRHTRENKENAPGDVTHVKLVQTPSEPTDTVDALVRQLEALGQDETPDPRRVGDDSVDGLVRQERAGRQVEDSEVVE